MESPCSTLASLLSSALILGCEMTLPSPSDSSAERIRSRLYALLRELNAKARAPPLPCVMVAGIFTTQLPLPDVVEPNAGDPVTDAEESPEIGFPVAALALARPPHWIPICRVKFKEASTTLASIII